MKRLVAYGAVAIVAIWAWMGLGVDLSRIGRAPAALAWLIGEGFPPDFSRFEIIWVALVETFQMSILATLFGTFIAIPFGILAARNLFPPRLATAVRTLANAIRVLPSILWGLVAVLVVGPGPLAGVLAMTFYTVGYLAKLQSEAFEGLPRDALDAVRAMGLGRGTVAWHVAIPEAANALRSQILFMLEYNFRNSSVVGLVGAGGIGILIGNAVQFYRYDRLAAVFIVMFAAVAVLDGVSYLARRRFVELEDAPRLRWRDVLLPR